MKKCYLKIYCVLLIFLIATISLQTNVSAMNQNDKKDVAILSTKKELVIVEKPIDDERLKSDYRGSSKLENIENTSGVNEEKSSLLTVKNIENNEIKEVILDEVEETEEIKSSEKPKVKVKVEVEENTVSEVEETEMGTEEIKSSEKPKPQVKVEETAVSEVGKNEDEEELLENEEIFIENREDLLSEETVEEETIIIDEEEFSPIIGLPSVKEEVEIEYEEEHKKEGIKKEATSVRKSNKKSGELETTATFKLQQPLEMKVLPQTSSDTLLFSKLGFILALISSVFILTGKK